MHLRPRSAPIVAHTFCCMQGSVNHLVRAMLLVLKGNQPTQGHVSRHAHSFDSVRESLQALAHGMAYESGLNSLEVHHNYSGSMFDIEYWRQISRKD